MRFQALATASRSVKVRGVEAAKAKHEFPCQKCGANLVFEPGAEALVCEYCGHTQNVGQPDQAPVVEYSFEEARARASKVDAKDLMEGGFEVRCEGCGATSVVTGHAERCAFCDSPVVVESGEDEIFRPESLLPFRIQRDDARERFERWLAGLWFAPSDLKRSARKFGLDGSYLPYWTYDSNTTTRYSGMRGDHYYDTETYTDSDGKTKTRQVRKTRWRPAFGTVYMSFDDVLVCATDSLPRSLIRKLEPWDLQALVPYAPAYLSGFQALRYDVDLEKGFEHAESRMQDGIRSAVRRDIGGDEQQIYSMNVRHDDVLFKHFLLPVWISSFRYKQKVYRFVVNARSGEVQGERPWSVLKITLAVVAALIVAGLLWYFLGQNG